MTGMSGMFGIPLEGLANVFGAHFGAHGWISRRSPCLLCVEFLVLE